MKPPVVTPNHDARQAWLIVHNPCWQTSDFQRGHNPFSQDQSGHCVWATMCSYWHTQGVWQAVEKCNTPVHDVSNEQCTCRLSVVHHASVVNQNQCRPCSSRRFILQNEDLPRSSHGLNVITFEHPHRAIGAESIAVVHRCVSLLW